jgi:curved DNA-binding protein CbpA
MAEALDYYEILQVSPNAETEVIDAAYRKLASKYHPDKNLSPDATRQMQNINVAYDVLKDPAKRRSYDQERAARAKRHTAQERHARPSAASSANAQQHTSTGASANTSQSQQRTSASSGEQSRSHAASNGATGAADRGHSTAQQRRSSHMGNSWRESPIERMFREAWQRRVPYIELEQEYEVQVLDHTYYIDFAHPATKTAIELDSFEYHAKTPDQYNYTVERRQALMRAGWEVYSITGRQINDRVDHCVDDARIRIETRMRAQRSAYEAAAQARSAPPPPNPQPRTPPTPEPQSTAAPPPFTPPPPSNTQYRYVPHEVTRIYEPWVLPAAAVSPTSLTSPTPTVTGVGARSASAQWAALPLWEQVLKLLAFMSCGAAAVMLGVAGFGLLVPLGGVETIPYLNVTSDWLIIALPVRAIASKLRSEE